MPDTGGFGSGGPGGEGGGLGRGGLGLGGGAPGYGTPQRLSSEQVQLAGQASTPRATSVAVTASNSGCSVSKEAFVKCQKLPAATAARGQILPETERAKTASCEGGYM